MVEPRLARNAPAKVDRLKLESVPLAVGFQSRKHFSLQRVPFVLQVAERRTDEDRNERVKASRNLWGSHKLQASRFALC